MPDYRRHRVSGGTHFFTVNLADRRSDLLVRKVATLRQAVRRVMTSHPFEIDAWVVLPNHLHAVWTLPPDDADFSTRWILIKRYFSEAIPCEEPLSRSRTTKHERGIWQRRFWEHTTRDATDFAAHVDYVYFNPVKHGMVSHASEWPFSSFCRAVARVDYPASWNYPLVAEGEFGERRP